MNTIFPNYARKEGNFNIAYELGIYLPDNLFEVTRGAMGDFISSRFVGVWLPKARCFEFVTNKPTENDRIFLRALNTQCKIGYYHCYVCRAWGEYWKSSEHFDKGIHNGCPVCKGTGILQARQEQQELEV